MIRYVLWPLPAMTQCLCWSLRTGAISIGIVETMFSVVMIYLTMWQGTHLEDLFSEDKNVITGATAYYVVDRIILAITSILMTVGAIKYNEKQILPFIYSCYYSKLGDVVLGILLFEKLELFVYVLWLPPICEILFISTAYSLYLWIARERMLEARYFGMLKKWRQNNRLIRWNVS